jgi:hypothetical protein
VSLRRPPPLGEPPNEDSLGQATKEGLMGLMVGYWCAYWGVVVAHDGWCLAVPLQSEVRIRAQ